MRFGGGGGKTANKEEEENSYWPNFRTKKEEEKVNC